MSLQLSTWLLMQSNSGPVSCDDNRIRSAPDEGWKIVARELLPSLLMQILL